MVRNRNKGQQLSDSSPSDAWLFAQAILGQRVPDAYAAQERARHDREELEWLALISPRHAAELARIESAEAQARRDRENLIWAAGISTEAEVKLRDVLREEAAAERARQRWQRYRDVYERTILEWNEADHPRHPKGTPVGGQFAPKGGGGGGTGQPPSQSPAVSGGDPKQSQSSGKPQPAAPPKSRATKTKAMGWSGKYADPSGRPTAVTFNIEPRGMRMSAAQEQAIADAVVEAVERFAEFADIIKHRRAQLKKHFADPNQLAGRMAHDDDIYTTTLANVERVMKGIRSGAVVLEADPRYSSENEPLLYTQMNVLTYNAWSEMRFGPRFVNAPHAEKVSVLMHEFGRRWGRQYGNDLDPRWGVGAWDAYIQRIYGQRDAIRKVK